MSKLPVDEVFEIKITQLRLERNYGEAIRLLQARLAQFHFDSQYDKACDQVALALMQRLAGDAAGAKITAEQARNTLEQLLQRSTRQRFRSLRHGCLKLMPRWGRRTQP